jgi:integrase
MRIINKLIKNNRYLYKINYNRLMVKFNPNIHYLRCIKCNKVLDCKVHRLKDGSFKCYKCGHLHIKPELPKLDIKTNKIKYKRRSVNDVGTWDKFKLIKELDKLTSDPYSLKKNDIRNFAFIAFMYLTASRVSEVVGIKKQGKKDIYSVPPIKKEQVYFSNRYGLKVLIIENIPVLKRRKTKTGQYPLRNLAIPFDHEPELIGYVEKWFNILPTDEETILFNFSSRWALYICDKYLGKFNHFWRHSRLSDLVKIYDFKDTQLQHYVGWSNTQMAAKYVHLSSDDLLKTMVSNWSAKHQQLKEI